MGKYVKIVMIWQVICTYSKKSFPLIISKTMTYNLYVTECLQNRILPLTREHNIPTKFWSDLDYCHYSDITMNWHEDNEDDVIPKIWNPPNCPEFRQIVRY